MYRFDVSTSMAPLPVMFYYPGAVPPSMFEPASVQQEKRWQCEYCKRTNLASKENCRGCGSGQPKEV